MKIKNLKLKIIFFGSSKFVIPIIAVLQKNFDLTFVVTTEKHPTDPLLSYCVMNKIPYLSVQQFNNLTIQQLKKLNTPVGILVSFGAIIPKSVLDIFKYGILNIHPSLLPKYRGPTPVQTAILNGEKTTGITIIKLDEEIDHGPILTQEKEPIFENDTAEFLYERLFKKGGEMLPDILNKHLKRNLVPIAQNHKNATFTNHLTRQHGFIDINNPPSIEVLKCMINAYHSWPSAWTRWVTGPDPVRGKILKLLPGGKIQVEGKKPMSYKDFINGYPSISPVMLNLIQHLERNKT